MKKLRLDYIGGMLATCRSIILYIQFWRLKIYGTVIFTCCFVWTWNFASYNKGKGIEWGCSSWGDFVCKREEVTGVGRKSHNEMLHNWYSSPNTVWVIKTRRCATRQTVPGSIPGGVTWDFFLWLLTKPCALRLTQPLKMSTRDLFWGKGGRRGWLTTSHPCSAESREDPGP